MNPPSQYIERMELELNTLSTDVVDSTLPKLATDSNDNPDAVDAMLSAESVPKIESVERNENALNADHHEYFDLYDAGHHVLALSSTGTSTITGGTVTDVSLRISPSDVARVIFSVCVCVCVYSRVLFFFQGRMPTPNTMPMTERERLDILKRLAKIRSDLQKSKRRRVHRSKQQLRQMVRSARSRSRSRSPARR